MASLDTTIRSIALSPIRRIGEQRLPENAGFRRAILRLRLAEFAAIKRGDESLADEMRCVIDDLVAAWRRR